MAEESVSKIPKTSEVLKVSATVFGSILALGMLMVGVVRWSGSVEAQNLLINYRLEEIQAQLKERDISANAILQQVRTNDLRLKTLEITVTRIEQHIEKESNDATFSKKR